MNPSFDENTGEYIGEVVRFHPYDGLKIGSRQLEIIESAYMEDGLHRTCSTVSGSGPHVANLIKRGIVEYDGEWLVLTREGIESIREKRNG